ncbi:MAG TPA: plastocyanin/azurin family copper-binding protein [Actinomycetota bacterium]|nr:plastocyanin/azurin family copper-binding protein [Actinomycetota bacterium]
MRKTLLLLAATMSMVAIPGSAVSGAEQRAVAGPAGFASGYLTTTITMSKGDSLVFTNLDVFEHDLVHDTAGDGFGGKRNVAWCKKSSEHAHDHSGACPVFWSDLIGAGDSTEVMGLNRVKPGKTYSFLCTKHHNMKGKLIVKP